MSSGKSPEQIEHEIEQTREQLGETVEALAAKTDVKAAAQRQLDAVRRKTPALAAVAGLAAVGAVAGGVVLVRRRRAAHEREERGRVARLQALAASVVALGQRRGD